MNAVGWCENCGSVAVWALCLSTLWGQQEPWDADHFLAGLSWCCQYADCPTCGEDVDQWEMTS